MDNVLLHQLNNLVPLDNSDVDYIIEPPNDVAKNNCKLILTYLDKANLTTANTNIIITASVEDGVAISFINAKKYADIECFNDGEMLAVINGYKSDTCNGMLEIWDVEANSESIMLALARIYTFIHL